jgi:hypothetical protein
MVKGVRTYKNAETVWGRFNELNRVAAQLSENDWDTLALLLAANLEPRMIKTPKKHWVFVEINDDGSDGEVYQASEVLQYMDEQKDPTSKQQSYSLSKVAKGYLKSAMMLAAKVLPTSMAITTSAFLANTSDPLTTKHVLAVAVYSRVAVLAEKMWRFSQALSSMPDIQRRIALNEITASSNIAVTASNMMVLAATSAACGVGSESVEMYAGGENFVSAPLRGPASAIDSLPVDSVEGPRKCGVAGSSLRGRYSSSLSAIC